MRSELTEPRRTSPLAGLFWVFQTERLRAGLPVLVLAAGSGRIVAVVMVGLVVGTAAGLASWWRRTWSFADGVLRLDEGIFVRNQRRIPVERIQHVELERRLRHQLFGLAAVRVETAGGSGAELRLDTIARAEAETLRSDILALLRTDAGPGGDDTVASAVPQPPAPPEVLVRLPPSRLLLAGITGPEVLAVLAAIAFALDTVTDLGVDPSGIDRIDASTAVVAAAVVVAAPVWFLAAGAVSVVRRWDLTAAIVGDELRVTYGLARRNEFVVKTGRVQDVRIAHRFLLRPFRRADLRVRTAASGQGDSSRVDVPLLDATEIDRILRRILPAAVPLPELVPAPRAARRRAWIRSAAIPASLAVVGAVLAAAAARPALAAAALVLVAVALARGEAAYRGLGQARADGVVHSRSGAWTRHRTMVPDGRVQSGAVTATVFQRRRRLGDVRLDLAAGSVRVIDRDVDEARTLVERTLAGVRPR